MLIYSDEDSQSLTQQLIGKYTVNNLSLKDVIL